MGMHAPLLPLVCEGAGSVPVRAMRSALPAEDGIDFECACAPVDVMLAAAVLPSLLSVVESCQCSCSPRELCNVLMLSGLCRSWLARVSMKHEHA